jgi:dolichol kinase
MTANDLPQTDPVVRSDDLSSLDRAATIEYRHEIVRKGIHLCSLSIPVIYAFISRATALGILVPLTVFTVAVDLARFTIPSFAASFYRWFGWLLRKHEQDEQKKRLNGASNVLIAATLSVLIFPKIIAINAFAILIISDTTSALIGRRFGRRRFLAKSLEGSTAFFVSALIVVFAAPKAAGLPVEYAFGVIAAALGAVVEASPIPIDDNLSIPISVGFILWGLYTLFLPGLISF